MPNKSFQEKVADIVNGLKETNYNLFDGDKEEAFDTLERGLDSFTNYFNVVVRNEIMTPIWRQRYEDQELRDQLVNADTRRRMAHDSAIGNLKMLNNISNVLDLEPFAEINTEDRYDVADFIGSYVSQVYYDGLQENLDKTVELAVKNHDELKKKSIDEIIADTQSATVLSDENTKNEFLKDDEQER